MARLIRHEKAAPLKVEPQETPIFICMCGLSQKFPFCDGAHKKCKEEADGRLYVYDRDRLTVADEQDDV